MLGLATGTSTQDRMKRATVRKRKIQSAKAWLPSLLRTKRNFGAPLSLGRLGNLEARLAKSASEIRKCQMLRYKVFYKERAAKAGALAKLLQRDADRLDAFCDHVLVLDHEPEIKNPLSRKHPRVVGTYRLLRQDVAEASHGFYSEDEYDIAPLIKRHAGLKFLELGRSCVLKAYRNKRTVELLWQGVWAYILAHKMNALIGCASLEGTDPEKQALALSYLHHHHSAPAEWQARALASRYIEMNSLSKDKIDVKKALVALPPLIKGYLRLGAMVGQGAVADKQFNTLDVMMILPVSHISEKYIGYFGKEAGRFGK
jgi:putative hemolysin